MKHKHNHKALAVSNMT